MWLAERINEKGIGNGISLILFANIISSAPSFAYQLGSLVVSTYQYFGVEYVKQPWLYALVSTLFAILLVAIILAFTVFVIWITGSERRIPVQYAKKVVGRKMYGGQSSHLPIKLNMTGVMPVIFASSIVSLVPTILAICGVSESTAGFWGSVSKLLASDGIIYPVSLLVLIIAFAYFYTQITFDPIEVANNLKRQGGAIPGIRQGRPTSDYIRKILNKITLAGAIFLAIIAVIPVVAGPHLISHILHWLLRGGVDFEYAATLGTWYESLIESSIESSAASLTSVFTFGGTTLLIVVGVAIETYRELEAQLTMRNYKGFLN